MRALVLACLLAGCGGDGSSTLAPSRTPAALDAVSGSGQTGTIGTVLSAPLVVRVTTSTGSSITGATVAFQVTSGGGSVSPASATTDTLGDARTTLTFGGAAGVVAATASVQGTGLTTTFTETASSGTTTTAPGCDTASVVLALGQAVALTGTSTSVGGGPSGAEYAVVPFNASTAAATQASFAVQAAGITPVVTALASRGPSGTQPIAAAASIAVSDAMTPFEAELRTTERRELAPRIPGARQWYAAWRGAGSARLDALPATVQVGQLGALNANAKDPCSRPVPHGGRVAAVSNRAIVVADTLNPPNGCTAADYQSIAVTLDTLVDVVDTRNFGRPTDIDHNRHAMLFFTSAVNALTPRNADYYVGGFFVARDIFPTTDTDQAMRRRHHRPADLAKAWTVISTARGWPGATTWPATNSG